MLPKAHLTSHSRMSGSRWVITPSWLSWSWTSFLYSFCVFLPPLLNIFCFCYIHTISVLYRAHLCMKCSLGFSNFLEEIFSLSHSVVFLYFLCIDYWGRLSYLFLLFFGILHSDANIFPFLLCLLVLFFSQLFVSPPQIAILLFFAFLFHGDGLDPCLLYNVTNLCP